jgi:GWxTD domain-containing protein
MRIKIYLLLVILFVFGKIALSQNFPIGIYSEYNLLSYDSSNVLLYYSFRVNNSFLVFEKVGDEYKASFSLIVEIYDSTDQFIKRESLENKITAKTFAESNSNEISTEGLLKFILKNDKFSIHPIYTDHNSRREFKLRNHVLFPKELLKHKILSPIILEERKTNSEISLHLSNYDGSIPFSNSSYSMLFPVTDKYIDTLFITLETEIDTLSFLLMEYMDGSIEMNMDEVIKVSNSKGKSDTRNFFLRDLSHKLIEGKLKIKAGINEKLKTPAIYHREVKWINKPGSLNNIEFAIKMLNYIEDGAVVSLIRKSKNQTTSLYNYWEKIDPSKETKFNELMKEFYDRVDYSIDNFTSISVKNGAESDRGKIWIVYGKPTTIQRSNSINGRVSEIWIYDNLNKTYTFIDKTGTGKFVLAEIK